MKKLKKKLRKFGFENLLDGWPDILDFKVNCEIKIRVHTINNEWLFFKNGSFSKIDWTSFTSIKDLKKQVKEKTGIELKKKDTPVSVELLVEKYGWDEDGHTAKHPLFNKNGICFIKPEDSDMGRPLATSINEFYTPCPTMRELKAYVLKHTGEKMKKVKGKSCYTSLLEKNGFVLHKQDSEENNCKFFDLEIEGEYLRIRLGKNRYWTYTEETKNDCEWSAYKLKTKQDLKDLVFTVFGLSLKQVREAKNKAKASGIATKIIKEAIEKHPSPFNPCELPKRWEDIRFKEGYEFEWLDNSSIEKACCRGMYHLDENDKDIVPKGLAAPILATCQLLLLRDVYRQWWKPDWNDSNKKYIIEIKQGEIYTNWIYSNEFIWSFQDAQTRDLFLENFKDLLEEHYKLYA